MPIKSLFALALVFSLIFASQVFLPLQINQNYPLYGTGAYWMSMAEKAWQYFQPGVGVDTHTGLHGAALRYPYFTEWDLGTYIQAIIDANELGILQKDGEWGFDYRVGRILNFLENRKLASNGLPYLWYDASTGEPHGDEITFSIDEGKLYMALFNLKLIDPDLTEEIDYIVKVRSNNAALIPDPESWLGSTDLYHYYVAWAFKAFGFEGWDNVPSSIMNTIVSQEKVSAYGVELPIAHISNEPLLLTFFEVNPQDARFAWLLSQVNLAQEARYDATGVYTAFSEGNTGLLDPTYVYEFVVDYDGSTFKVAPSITPIDYLKVAVAFDAIFDSEYTNNAVNYIRVKVESSSGFRDGVSEDRRILDTTADRTNGMIISAANYVIKNSNSAKIFWKNYDLNSFPYPLVNGGVENNVSVVVGESQPHGLADGAQTLDYLGGMLVVERLAKESTNDTLKPTIDSWLVNFDSVSGLMTLLDNSTNLIIIGSPKVNVLSLYFNNLGNDFWGSFVPVQYVQTENSNGSDSYLYVQASGSLYKREFDAEGNLVIDYAVIMGFQDQPYRYVLMAYGLGPEATLGACQFLRDYRQRDLHGSAIILKFDRDKPGNYPGNSSIVEVVP